MITVNDPEIGDRLRILRAHGWLRNVRDTSRAQNQPGLDSRYTFVNWGFNVRPTELQAGFGLHQLDKINGFNERRRVLAKRFFAYIDKVPFLSRPAVVSPLADPCWFALPIMVSPEAPFSRPDITQFLEGEGMETRPFVAGNLARHPVAQMFPEFQEKSFPGADEVHDCGFYIGLSPMISDSSLDRLIACMDNYLSKYH